MINDFRGDWRQRVLDTFPERQIYVRSGGEVKSLTLTTRQQVGFVSVLALLVVWFLATLVNMAWGHNPLRSSNQNMKLREARLERELDDIKAREAEIRAQLERERSTFAQATERFEEKHETLAQLLERSGRAETVKPITTVQYAASEVLMAPTVRDALPRRARRDAMPATTATATSRTLGRDFASLDEKQNSFLVAAEADTQDRIERNRAILAAAEVDPVELVAQGPLGKGGPLVEAIEPAGADGTFGSRIASIKARVAEADALDAAMSAVPLGYPVSGENWRTSNYGVRKDPFTGRPTFHEGLDFSARRMTDIVSTADGEVTFVGRRGGYGKVVEVDHGHGFITRYAHLEKTFVKRGQRVEQGETIAGMGSTGRSTATHLHYEVHFQGRVYDPAKFLKAGRYVQ